MSVILKLNKEIARNLASYTVGISDNIIAEMHKNKAIQDKVRVKDTYSLTVYPNVDYAFLVAMCAVLDKINTPRNRSGGGGGGGGCGGGGGGGD
ncbi:hypothetical protein C5167_014678 [Papaver somniferum]|uniref:Tubby C-terminal domain-containing protein n=1 Tax=Papaver somniferum TaxID=3469 RepID=A0A4Y7J7S3_PAPSO|nr:hypothetical protein C5167_014678 [Papaver somniferum]